MIVIIDYNMGNLKSVLNMFRYIGVEATISDQPGDIQKAEKLVISGVGTFDKAVKQFKEKNLMGMLNQRVLEQKIPILGICLGMQLMTRNSEEGILDGFGWINAQTVRFNFDDFENKLNIPHMGWNFVQPARQAILTRDMNTDSRYYFVHSYHVVCNDDEDILSTTHYGYDFVSSFQKENIFGCQFHPEKSHKFGMKLLRAFSES